LDESTDFLNSNSTGGGGWQQAFAAFSEVLREEMKTNETAVRVLSTKIL
jgi:hypothetical protein